MARLVRRSSATSGGFRIPKPRIPDSKTEKFVDSGIWIVQFCEHESDREGLHKTQEKVEAVISAPRPENVSQLRSFLGLVNYYNRFLPNASTVLHPLHQLLEQNSEWQWTEQCEQAFTEAKRMITSEQVLTHYDPVLPVKLACDASPTGIGAFLSHVMPDGSERPVAFASRSLTKTERKYAQIDKEALSIVCGVKRFHVYLYGRRFTLITDHKPLTAIFHPEKGVPAMTAARLQRYALFLAGFDYRIEYKSTTEHCNVDGLSRLPLQQKELEEMGVDSSEVFHATQFASLPVTSEAVSRETRRDPVLARIHEPIVKGWSARVDGDKPYYERRNKLTVHQDCILWGMRVVILNKLQDRVLEELHDGHMGVAFVKSNNIRHITSAPYHPATNGLAETAVQTIKQTLRSMHESSKPVKEKLAKFLIAYRNTPHFTTGASPAQLLLGRPLRTRLDLVKPNLNRKMVNQQHQQSIRAANEKGRQRCQLGDSVMSRDYRGDLNWRAGLIVNTTGPLMYEVKVAPGIICRRHIDQLKPTAVEVTDTDTVEVSQPKVASVPPAPIQLSTPPNVTGTVPEIPEADQPEMVSVPTFIAPEATPISSPVREKQYPQRVRRAPQRLDL
ncbi:uncharacterized protein [Montipora foliosa]|uniref:uncharacterized protein n=1 Tax=Montipora foliosa TaxID=591990 RepID=UPI0035F17D7B